MIVRSTCGVTAVRSRVSPSSSTCAEPSVAPALRVSAIPGEKVSSWQLRMTKSKSSQVKSSHRYYLLYGCGDPLEPRCGGIEVQEALRAWLRFPCPKRRAGRTKHEKRAVPFCRLFALLGRATRRLARARTCRPSSCMHCRLGRR